MIKNYEYESGTDDTVEIAIDTEIVTEQLFTDLNNFWSDSKIRVIYAEGDVMLAYLKFLAEYALQVRKEKDLNSYGVMKHFDNEEGFCSMDGSFGILIHKVHTSDYEATLLKVSRLDKMPNLPKGNF
jgi:hypothetical protein